MLIVSLTRLLFSFLVRQLKSRPKLVGQKRDERQPCAFRRNILLNELVLQHFIHETLAENLVRAAVEAATRQRGFILS